MDERLRCPREIRVGVAEADVAAELEAAPAREGRGPDRLRAAQYVEVEVGCDCGRRSRQNEQDKDHPTHRPPLIILLARI
jgi:hypothetical protein